MTWTFLWLLSVIFSVKFVICEYFTKQTFKTTEFTWIYSPNKNLLRKKKYLGMVRLMFLPHVNCYLLFIDSQMHPGLAKSRFINQAVFKLRRKVFVVNVKLTYICWFQIVIGPCYIGDSSWFAEYPINPKGIQ